jgi:hypothetical protein
MKKTFLIPTISSVNKVNDSPAHLKDKIHKLTNAIYELKVNVA